ncbi:MAG: DUF488 domain-containing protein [Armatimonadetes bacterium]|nr:DUF488 domain-containing protein [Armatimonadota bacterium]
MLHHRLRQPRPGCLHRPAPRTRQPHRADVRQSPHRAYSGSYAKSRTPERGIERLLSEAGIGCAWLPELGNPYRDAGDWEERYEDLLEREGEERTKRLLPLPAPWCLLCAEMDANRCHRKRIAAYLERQGWAAAHL